MKKFLALLLSAVIFISLTACSQSELDFYNTMKGLVNLDTFSYEGKTTVDIKKFNIIKGDVPQEAQKQIQMIKDMFAGKTFVYSGNINSKDNTLNYHMAVQTPDGKTTDFLDLKGKGQNLYLSKDFAGQLPDSQKLPVETIDGKEYIAIDLKMIVENMFTALEQEEKQNNHDVTELEKCKSAMLEKANAVYFIKMYKDIAIKGADAASTDLLDKFSADLIKKDGDKYTLHFGNTEITKVLNDVTAYINGNQEKVITATTKFLRSLSNEQLVMVGINPKYLDEIINDLKDFNKDDLKLKTNSPMYKFENGKLPNTSDNNLGLLTAFDIGYDLSVEKIGSISYALSEAVTMKPKQEFVNELGLDFDIAINNTCNINKASNGNIQIKSDVTESKTNSASIKLNVTDPSIKECGIVYSASSDLANSKKIAGVKQTDGSFTVSLAELNGDTTYYYKLYTVDANSNYVLLDEVKNFKTAKNTDPEPTTTTTTAATTTKNKSDSSPATGESSSAVWYILALCSAAVSLTLIKLQSKSKQRS